MSYIIVWAAESERRRHSVKELFLGKGAVSPESAIDVENVSPTQRATLQRLVKERVVLKVDGKHYFDVEGEEAYLRRARRHNWLVALALALVATVMFLILNNR